MPHQFRKHYTREEARALLDSIRGWLSQLVQLRDRMLQIDQRLGQVLAHGQDSGGEAVNELVRLFVHSRDVLREFTRREIQLKDLDRGLVDFPSLVGGREVFLCWEKDEDDIEFWHDLDNGYAGRERL